MQNGRMIQIEDLFVPPASLVQNADAGSVPQSTPNGQLAEMADI